MRKRKLGLLITQKHRVFCVGFIWIFCPIDTNVRIPRGYSVCDVAWEDIPRDRAIFKFCEKHSKDSDRAGTSVLYPEAVGKGRFTRQCYQRGTIVAQDLVPTLEANDKICQVILLTDAHAIITGYVLWAPRGTRIITDAYEHAPLIWG